jgi:hypothetical protein
MNKLMIILVAGFFVFGPYISVQAADDKIPTSAEVKEQVKRDIETVKKEVKKTKDAVEKDMRSDIEESKKSVEKVKQEVKSEVNRIKK